jgi:hypothetical protein
LGKKQIEKKTKKLGFGVEKKGREGTAKNVYP